MASKKQLMSIGILVTVLLIAIALIVGLCLCFLWFKDRHYESSAGDTKLIDDGDRGIFCSSYSVEASTNPDIGTNTIPTFSLYQGKKSDLKPTRKPSPRTTEGSNAISERSEERLTYQAVHLKGGAKVNGHVCASQFVLKAPPRPGLFVAATTDLSELTRISDNVKVNETNITCNGCIFSKTIPTLKKCLFLCPPENASCLHNWTKYAFSVNKTGDYFIGYIYLTKNKAKDVKREPSWAELQMSNTIKQKLYNMKIGVNSSWVKLSSNKMEGTVHNFSNADTLLVKFSKPLGDPDLPLTNIDILYRCNPTIWLYMVLFLLIPLLIAGILWAVLYFLIRRSQTGSGLLAPESE